ncbi:MAG: tetratricopeptide repeat protein [Acidobacteriota bacterium]|nr:tetratricopeptide repeat protein [Acidobacteriota bacterium]
MRLRLIALLLIVTAVCAAQAPPASHKALSKEEVLELTRNYVPSPRLAQLVPQYGINFVPGEDFLTAVREAGGEDVLITALRAAKPSRSPDSAAPPDANDVHLKQLLAHGAELKKQKQYAQAEEEYRAALKLDSERADIHFSLGYVELEQKKYDEAIAENREALRLRPEMAAAHNNLGLALARKGDRDGAKAEYQEAVRIRPKYALAHHNLGLVLEKQGNLEAAAQEFRTACQLEPDNSGYRASLEKVAGHAPASPAGQSEPQALHLKLESVRFFESGNDLTPKDERKYAIRFKRSSTRLIEAELQMVHPKPESRADFDIVTMWYDPANNLVHQGTHHALVPAGSADSLHAAGWGCPEHPCSKWLKGTYHVEFIVAGTKLATGSFEIY